MNLRNCITSSLCAAAILTGLLIVAGSLWAILYAVGDESLAPVMQGITLLTAVCWVIDFIALVLFLSLAQLSSDNNTIGNTRKKA